MQYKWQPLFKKLQNLQPFRTRTPDYSVLQGAMKTVVGNLIKCPVAPSAACGGSVAVMVSESVKFSAMFISVMETGFF